MSPRRFWCTLLICGCGSVLTSSARGDLTAADITAAVKRVVESPDHAAKYAPVGVETKCNFFARDVVNLLLKAPQAELEGNANLQFKNLTESTKWQALGLNSDPRKVLKQAQDLANQGVLVLAVYKNPDGGHGHIAVVVPGTMQPSPTEWKVDVPMIAQAGKKGPCPQVPAAEYLFASIKLSCGFGVDKRPHMELFRYGK